MCETDPNPQQFVQILNSRTAALKNQINALIQLHQVGGSEAWWAICRYCGHRQTRVAEISRHLIKKMDDHLVATVLRDWLRTKRRTLLGVTVFQVLSQMHLQATLKYIVASAREILDDAEKQELLVDWFKKTQFHEKLTLFLVQLSVPQSTQKRRLSPSKPALTLGAILMKIDDRLPHVIARYATQQKYPPGARLIALGLLETAAIDRQLLKLLLPVLRDENEYVRSKAVKISGLLLLGDAIFNQLMADENARVRANTIESIWNVSYGSEEQRTLMHKKLVDCLQDSSAKVRANAARALHEMGDAIGLETLKQMAVSKDRKMRASSVWMVADIWNAEAGSQSTG